MTHTRKHRTDARRRFRREYERLEEKRKSVKHYRRPLRLSRNLNSINGWMLCTDSRTRYFQTYGAC